MTSLNDQSLKKILEEVIKELTPRSGQHTKYSEHRGSGDYGQGQAITPEGLAKILKKILRSYG